MTEAQWLRIRGVPNNTGYPSFFGVQRHALDTLGLMMYSGADPKNEKRDAYEAAAKLAAAEDEASLRYAALELRRCLAGAIPAHSC